MRHDTQPNDTQHNDIEPINTQHNDIELNDAQHNDIRHYNTHLKDKITALSVNDTQQNDS